MSTYPSSTGNNPTRGVYFLADDHMVDLVIAFLNSFRRYNPDLPLCMIPFNNNTARLECLQPRFRFSMYPYPQLCEACDVISKQFFPRVVGHFRKLAAWEGNFDKFIYIDIDNLVLRDVSSVYRHLQAYDIVTCDSNVKFNVRWVWKDSIYSSGLLTVSQIEYAANTSFIASKKGTLSIADILANLSRVVELAPHMVLACNEQPFLNYQFVTCGRRYSSLLWLSANDIQSPGSSPVEHGYWAGAPGGMVIPDGQFVVKGSKSPILFIHWSGVWHARRLERVYFALRNAILPNRLWKTPMRFQMPYKALWKYYRLYRGNGFIRHT